MFASQLLLEPIDLIIQRFDIGVRFVVFDFGQFEFEFGIARLAFGLGPRMDFQVGAGVVERFLRTFEFGLLWRRPATQRFDLLLFAGDLLTQGADVFLDRGLAGRGYPEQKQRIPDTPTNAIRLTAARIFFQLIV